LRVIGVYRHVVKQLLVYLKVLTGQDFADTHDELLASLFGLVVVRLLDIMVAAQLEQELLDKALHAVVLLLDFLHDRHLAAINFA
jgi:hypothetical protein